MFAGYSIVPGTHLRSLPICAGYPFCTGYPFVPGTHLLLIPYCASYPSALIFTRLRYIYIFFLYISGHGIFTYSNLQKHDTCITVSNALLLSLLQFFIIFSEKKLRQSMKFQFKLVLNSHSSTQVIRCLIICLSHHQLNLHISLVFQPPNTVFSRLDTGSPYHA